ncbi:MAG: NAD(P)H-dependent oxidoreductase subunit E [Pseudomonadota bacterium]|nr:NAD(P)H-dependent oxidoreductase subunit E [Pseudomonadota bacterium]
MKDIESTIKRLLTGTGNAPDRLLQDLCTIQQLYTHIPAAAVELLADKLNIPPAQIYGLVDFYAFLHREARGDFDILFSDNITDRMFGNQALIDSLCKRLGVKRGVPRPDNRVTVDVTSCTGICDQGPAMMVNGRVVSRLDAGRISKIAELVETGVPVADWPESFFVVEDNIQRRDLLLSNQIANGSAIDSLLHHKSDGILAELEKSSLRGRGGAGFKTAMKWRYCRDAEADEHYVVCNADEGEPGTFKDRVLLNSYGDTLFEGMTLCAGVIGAKKGILYLRGEYRYLLDALKQTLQRRRNEKLLGEGILGQQGFDFDIEIHLGAGAYICGEESALIESLEGKRGIPRVRPPFPVTHGYLNKPTVVNNVETFIAAAKIAVLGADWFRSVGTEESAGSKLLSISGDVERPGIYEFPFGVTINEILDACGTENIQAVQVAGAAGATISPQEFNRTIAFEDISTAGSFMVFSGRRNLIDMVQNFAHFFCHESCGLCTPCRVGGTLMKDLVEKVIAGHATRYDLNEMRNIGQVMKQASHCGLGATAANHIFDTLEKFPYIYEQHLSHSSYGPAFDLDAALGAAREITGRDDAGAHLRDET